MKYINEKALNLLMLFIVCVMGITITFLCIALSVDILVWILTGSFDLTKIEILKIIKIDCAIGSFTGAIFVIANLLKLRGF
ncbi:hypothetical protein OCT50_21710 [Leclercia adecarboxylata]|uniref:hypothetical protein n=1 Tax=Leclercia adecarboxylata TaxID=83655 RepID=UPI0025B1C234|nr:hypothetical protein [Leclercia adecarboxylata]WJT03144.1 hypothetical protein OCT50_21710 [Leclercia adecarboxylata]